MSLDTNMCKFILGPNPQNNSDKNKSGGFSQYEFAPSNTSGASYQNMIVTNQMMANYMLSPSAIQPNS